MDSPTVSAPLEAPGLLSRQRQSDGEAALSAADHWPRVITLHGPLHITPADHGPTGSLSIASVTPCSRRDAVATGSSPSSAHGSLYQRRVGGLRPSGPSSKVSLYSSSRHLKDTSLCETVTSYAPRLLHYLYYTLFLLNTNELNRLRLFGHTFYLSPTFSSHSRTPVNPLSCR